MRILIKLGDFNELKIRTGVSVQPPASRRNFCGKIGRLVEGLIAQTFYCSHVQTANVMVTQFNKLSIILKVKLRITH
jgi:hypothetical protein